MTGALTVNHQDGVYTTRNGAKTQMSLNNNGWANFNVWNTSNVHQGALQLIGFSGGNTVSGQELRLIRADGTAYNVYGQHNITAGTADMTPGTSALASGSIYIQYE
jgi:hypothetical protein